MTQSEVNSVSFRILACAIEVNRVLGPGLLESIYHKSLICEMQSQGLEVKSKVAVPVYYKGNPLGDNLCLDLLVNDCVIVELKSVDALNPVFQAQLLTYMKLTQIPKGLLINFNSTNISKNTIRLVNEFFSRLNQE
ncbi:MAG: GxxExxY protein [Bacteroidetes bacterium]|nr:GxxExxY protein [Bacteroidota bacterium]